MSLGVPWTAEEDALVRRIYKHSSTRRGRALARCCEALPHRTPSAIGSRAAKLRAAVHSRRWTREELATLRREWGELGERTLRAKLPGRTTTAIYGKARELGLDPQSCGREGFRQAARRLGVDDLAVRKLIAEAGMTLGMAAPVTVRQRKFARREVDADALETLLRLRDLRCATASAWDTRHGLTRSVTASRARRMGVPLRGAPGGRVYVPTAVLAEVHDHAVGPACALWRSASDAAREVGCAAWVLHLAATDLRAGGAPAEWTGECLPQRVEAAARALAGLREAPGTVRCGDGAERAGERAA